MPLDDAMALVKRRRPEANPIPEFVAMLRDYETQCRLDGSIVDVAAAAATKSDNDGSKKRAAVGPSRPDAPKQQHRSMPTIGPLRPPVNVVGPSSLSQLAPHKLSSPSSPAAAAAVTASKTTNERGDAAMEQGNDAAAPSSSESPTLSAQEGGEDEGETSSTLHKSIHAQN